MVKASQLCGLDSSTLDGGDRLHNLVVANIGIGNGPVGFMLPLQAREQKIEWLAMTAIQ